MFRRFVSDTTNSMNSTFYGTIELTKQNRVNGLFNLHVTEIQALLEMAWSFRVDNNSLKLGSPYNKSDLAPMPEKLLELFSEYGNNKGRFFPEQAPDSQNPQNPPIREGAVMWDHLIYAYIIESTQILKVFEKVLKSYANGDIEISLDAATQQWLHNTEALWFCNTQPFSTYNIASQIRPDIGATRRSAYYKFFGFSLPSDTREDGSPYPFHQPKSSNTNFRRNFERLCEEVWVGIINVTNASGYNLKDDAVIAFNAFEIQKNFRAQRNNGDLSKQEFYYVSMLSWFHLALEYNSPIIKAFGIDEESPAQRLFALANIVGVPANGLSENLFRLADPLSILMTVIETGIFNEDPAQLYSDADIQVLMRNVIFNWSQLTGVDLKVRQGQNTAAYPLQQGNGLPANNGLSLALPG